MATVTERIADLAVGVLLKPAEVVGVERVSPHVVRVDLRSEAFRSSWTPGAKVQLRLHPGTWSLRTYTPIPVDGAPETARLLAYTHGGGPASEWFGRVAVGDRCEVFGPRGSIDLPALAGPVLFVGDESGIGLACALRTLGREVRHVVEAGDPGEITEVLAGLGLGDTATVVPKTADRGAMLDAARAAAFADRFDLVVTGDAATVHVVRRAVRGWSPPPAATKGKAYWAQGRTGLD